MAFHSSALSAGKKNYNPSSAVGTLMNAEPVPARSSADNRVAQQVITYLAETSGESSGAPVFMGDKIVGMSQLVVPQTTE